MASGAAIRPRGQSAGRDVEAGASCSGDAVPDLSSRRTGIAIDFAWPTARLAVEVDHPAWHDGAVDSHADKGRDRKLGTIGWSSARITDIDVNAGLREAVTDIGNILARLTRAA